MNKVRLSIIMIIVCLLSLVLLPLSAQDTVLQITRAEVETIPQTDDESPRTLEGHATLYTGENGTTMVFITSELEANHVYTAWWVLMNNPSACETTPCSPTDVIGNAEAVGTQITFADSLIADESGQATFASYLPAGTIDNGWYDQDFENPLTAEIHIVINDHGELISDLAQSMLSTYRGGCTDDSLPPPFPDTAKADGEDGTNSCALVQDAIFIQSQ